MRRLFKLLTKLSLVALMLTLILWPLSYRDGGISHTFETSTFLLEGKENIVSLVGVSVGRGAFSMQEAVRRDAVSKSGEITRGTTRFQTTRLNIPLWLPAIVFAILPCVAFYRTGLRRSRLARGLCVDCGYDLRDSSGACPGCGRNAKESVGA